MQSGSRPPVESTNCSLFRAFKLALPPPSANLDGRVGCGSRCVGVRFPKRLLDDIRAITEVDTMCMIKQALDPLNIMNPGKIFLDTPAAAKAPE
jgi:hypothetical protein